MGSPEVSATCRDKVGALLQELTLTSSRPVCRRRGPRLRGEPVRVQEWGLWRLQRLLQQVQAVVLRRGAWEALWGRWHGDR